MSHGVFYLFLHGLHWQEANLSSVPCKSRSTAPKEPIVELTQQTTIDEKHGLECRADGWVKERGILFTGCVGKRPTHLLRLAYHEQWLSAKSPKEPIAEQLTQQTTIDGKPGLEGLFPPDAGRAFVSQLQKHRGKRLRSLRGRMARNPPSQHEIL